MSFEPVVAGAAVAKGYGRTGEKHEPHEKPAPPTAGFQTLEKSAAGFPNIGKS